MPGQKGLMSGLSILHWISKVLYEYFANGTFGVGDMMMICIAGWIAYTMMISKKFKRGI